MRLSIFCIYLLYAQLSLAQNFQFLSKKQLTLRNIYSTTQDIDRAASISINGQERIILQEIDYSLIGFDLGFSAAVAPSTMAVFRLGVISRNSDRFNLRSTSSGNGFDELNYSYQITTPFIHFGLLYFYYTKAKLRAGIGAEAPFELMLRDDELVREQYNATRQLQARRVELNKHPIQFAFGLEISHSAYYQILNRISIGLELGLQLRYILQDGNQQIQPTFFDGSGNELLSVEYSIHEQYNRFHTTPIFRLGIQYSWD
jgi:hypothetical protein